MCEAARGGITHAQREESLRKELGIPEDAPVVGAVARLFPRKGYEDFFPAANKVLEKNPDVYFLIMGDGPMWKEYEELTERLGIRSHVVFAGLVSPDEISRYIAQMDLVAHFSLKEGLPRVAVQALAEKKPVVAYPLDGTPEVVLDGKSGYLVPVGDHDKASERILQILSDRELHRSMGEYGCGLVKNLFDWPVMSRTLIGEYERLLALKNRTGK